MSSVFLLPDGNQQFKEFPGQQKGEIIEVATVRHWITLFPYLFMLFIDLAVIILINIFWFQLNPDIFHFMILVVINSIALAILAHLFFIRILNYFLKNIVVTNYRILELNCTTVLHRERKMIDMLKILDIEINQTGLIQRMFDYGVIAVHNASGETIFVFNYIPHPSKFYNRLNHIYRKAVAQMSTIAEKNLLQNTLQNDHPYIE